jgi:hypothetical protein
MRTGAAPINKDLTGMSSGFVAVEDEHFQTRDLSEFLGDGRILSACAASSVVPEPMNGSATV